MRVGNVGSADSLEPNGAGCIERHRMALDVLRTSMNVPGSSSWSRSSLRPAKPLHVGGCDDSLVVDAPVDATGDVVVDELTGKPGGCPVALPGDGPPEDGKAPRPSAPRDPLPRAPSRAMCDC